MLHNRAIHYTSDITTEKVMSRIESIQTSRENIMLTQDNRTEKQVESQNITLIKLIIMWCPYTSNNTYQDTQNLNHKTYRIKKLKFSDICIPNHSQTYIQTGLTAPYQKRTKSVPRAYRNPKKRTKWYIFKD